MGGSDLYDASKELIGLDFDEARAALAGGEEG
jgi:hypothetical protein